MNEWLNQLNWEALTTQIQSWGYRVILALLIFIIGWWISKRIGHQLARFLDKRDWDGILVSFLVNVLNTLVLAAVIIAALDVIGVQTTSLLAILGAAGLAIGLALKDSLGNLASGVMLVGLRPFREGDFVEIADTSGTVDEVRIFHTTLLTPDNRRVIVPNAQITNSVITNYTAQPTRRIDMVIGISYDDDIKLARSVIAQILTSHPDVLKEPEPVIMLLELGASSVDFAVRPWVKKEDYWRVRSDLLELMKTELEQAGCSIPYPQRDVHNYHHNVSDETISTQNN